MRFSARLNNDLHADQYLELARAAEECGLDQLWVSHDLFLRSAPVLVARMLAATERLQVGIGILNPYTQHAAEIAMLAATMDEAFDRRFLIGLAAGATDFLSWVGIEQRSPLGTVRESVATIRALLEGGKAPDGEHLRATEQAYLRFEAPRSTPIYVGAMGPRMLELAGEVGDGALPLLFPPEHFFEVKEIIERGESRRHGGLEDLDLAVCIWVSIDSDTEVAQRVLARKVAYYGYALSPLILKRLGLTRADFEPLRALVHDRDDLEAAADLVTPEMLAIGVAGDAEAVCARLRPLVEAGGRHLSFGPPLGPDPVSAIRQLGDGVVRVLREEYEGLGSEPT